MPLRIVVGHKGIGKSALIKIAISEDKERGHLAVLIRPDDILSIASQERSFLEIIRDWKEGLTSLLASRVVETLGLPTDDLPRQPRLAGRLINLLTSVVRLK